MYKLISILLLVCLVGLSLASISQSDVNLSVDPASNSLSSIKKDSEMVTRSNHEEPHRGGESNHGNDNSNDGNHNNHDGHNTEAPTTPPTRTPTHPPTHAPTSAPTHAPTHAPTSAPTHAPTHAPTSAPTHAPTSAPTSAPTHAPTSAPTHAPTSAPTHAPTVAATHAPTTAPSGGSGCSGGMKMLVPLYVYPGSSWNTVISGAASVPTIAIINPDSGPGGAPDSSYTSYMQQMANAGITMIGYVHTSYGARSLSDVEADINTYATEWSHLSGIFLDEVATSSSELSYYQSLYNYITSLPGFTYDIINPGALPDSGYASAASHIVVIEDTASNVAGFSAGWLTCDNKEKYAAIINAASGSSTMESTVNSLVSKGYFGLVYVTDGSGGSAYNNLASYYSTEISYVASKN